VTTFGAAPSDTDAEEDPPRFEELGYAATCTEQLHKALLAAGYTGELVTDPAQLGAAALGERVD
jgi:hypothetical protein